VTRELRDVGRPRQPPDLVTRLVALPPRCCEPRDYEQSTGREQKSDARAHNSDDDPSAQRKAGRNQPCQYAHDGDAGGCHQSEPDRPCTSPLRRVNKTLVRRKLAENVILDAVKDQLADPEHVAYVLERVEAEIAKLRADLPDTLNLKQAELSSEQRRLANFVDSSAKAAAARRWQRRLSRPSGTWIP
jgi:hypothetical protein